MNPDDNDATDWADVEGSERAPMAFALDLRISGLDTDGDEERESPSAAPWVSTWPVFARPADPSDDGKAQALIYRRGDERIVIAVGDARWLLDLDKGDAVLTAASTGSRVVLRANGKASIVSDDVCLSSEDPGDYAALASEVNDKIGEIQRALDAFAAAPVSPNDGGLALQTALKTTGGWGTSPHTVDVAAAKVRIE